ncbi:MAG: helix-turn-helix domain-containing protein [Syntrophales bacterium]
MGRKETTSSGGYLKKTREAKKISIAELSRKTQLSPELLLAIEETRFESFSQPEFIPGYLKLYARQLGIEEADALKEYKAFAEIPKQIKDIPIQTNLFLDYNPPIRAAGQAPKPAAHNNGNSFKHFFLILFTILIVSLFFYIPSEYKGPREIRSDTSRVAEMKKDAPATPSNPQTAASSPRADTAPSGKDALPHASPLAVATPASPVNREPEKAIKVIGNRDSKRYHLPGMKYYDHVAAYHRVVFASEEEAVKAGYHKAPR